MHEQSIDNKTVPLMPPEVVFVDMKEWEKASADSDRSTLATFGLGPCIGLTIYDKETREGWMGHFANLAFEQDSARLMLTDALASGDSSNLKVWVRGGQRMPETNEGTNVSLMSREATELLLLKSGIAEDSIDVHFDDRTWGEGATNQRLNILTGEFYSETIEPESVIRQLGRLGFNTSRNTENVIEEASHEKKNIDMSTDIKMSATYERSEKHNEPIAVITSLQVSGNGAKAEWLAGFTPYHHELRMESQQVDDPKMVAPIEVLIDGMAFKLYAEFSPRSKRMSKPHINWRFSGHRAEFDKVRSAIDRIISKTSDDITNVFGIEVANDSKTHLSFRDNETNTTLEL